MLKSEKQDVDTVLEKVGGVGRFQIIHFGIVASGMLAGSLVLYSIYYFVMDPVYTCEYEDGWKSCTKTDICANPK